MEKKTKTLLICVIVTLLLVVILIAILPNKIGKKVTNYEVVKYKGEEYYIITDDYKKEYDIKYLDLGEYFNSESVKEDLADFPKQEVMTYKEYKEYCSKWNVKQAYDDKDKSYIVLSYAAYGKPNIKVRLADVSYNKNTAMLYVWDDSSGVTADISAYVLTIPTTDVIDKVEVTSLLTKSEYRNIKKYGTVYDPSIQTEDKPIIYLYPTKEENITVKYLNEENLLVSYPKYENEWSVKASPNGKLIDNKTGRELYALYYESKSVSTFNIEDEGFIVKGSDTAKFLEEKLEILGLNARESEEFIVYWLPILEQNEYNYIRFASKEEIEENSPLEVNPQPETEIRVLMTYKGLDNKIEVQEQQLIPAERQGYTLVEWGGLEIK